MTFGRLGSLGAGFGRLGGSSSVSTDALERLNIFITSDVDTGGHETGDIADILSYFLTQDHFNIVGIATDGPDGDIAGIAEIFDAYEDDLPNLLTHVPDPSHFKSVAELSALCVQGAGGEVPSTLGYFVPGDDEYDAVEAAAQALIDAAVLYGDPDSNNPKRKLWLVNQGAFNVLGQACRKAIHLGSQPDFLKRIRVLAQPNWNTIQRSRSWQYLCGDKNNCWPSEGVPGMFGDLWMICSYWLSHTWQDWGFDGLYDDLFGLGTPSQFYNGRVKNHGFLGPRFDELAIDYPGFWRTEGLWPWLIHAKIRNNFNPTATGNLAGVYRTYAGETWPAQIVGYPENPAAGPGWSPTVFCPPLTVTDLMSAIAACDGTTGYLAYAEIFDRIRRPRGPANPVVTRMLEMPTMTPAYGTPPGEPVMEFFFDEGTGTTLTDQSRRVVNGSAINTPSWVTGGLDFNGTDQRVQRAYGAELNTATPHLFASVHFDSVSGFRAIICRQNGGASTIFQFQNNAGKLEFVIRDTSNVSFTCASTNVVLTTTGWYIVEAWLDATTIHLKVNGVDVGSAAFTNGGLRTDITTGAVQIAARQSGGSTYTNFHDGAVGYAAMYDYNLTAQQAAYKRADIVAIMEAKGVTITSA